MDNNPADKAPRTDVELLAIAQALSRTGGEAPAWLKSEMKQKLGLGPIPQDPDAYRWHMKAALTTGALLLSFIGGVDFVAEVNAAPHLVARPSYVVDEDARDAIFLVQGSVMAGDDSAVLARLGGVRRHADGAARAWSAEKTGDDSYLVIYREPAGVPAYAFEVNLETEAVAPTPEAADALAVMRVRAVEEHDRAVAAGLERASVAAN
ncbi:MAG: hypothetical protein M0D55_07855 [Elusimicrobiota bacterium]|nr:MAG: hypothetical protein M0D55_07855 [Elusimicrobiota bacterium]